MITYSYSSIINPEFGLSGTTPTRSLSHEAVIVTNASLPYRNCAEVGMTWCDASKRSTIMSQPLEQNTMPMETWRMYGSISELVAAKLTNRLRMATSTTKRRLL